MLELLLVCCLVTIYNRRKIKRVYYVMCVRVKIITYFIRADRIIYISYIIIS